MSIELSSLTQYGDAPGFLDFLNVHQIAHQNINAALQRIGNGVDAVDMGVLGKDELQVHYQIHLQIASRLNQDVDDLSEVDFSKQDQFDDWMQRHSYFHSQIDTALGLS